MKDIIVIGGGIVGVCSAAVLARGGRETLLIERGNIGGETSYGNAGVLADCYVVVANNPDLWRKLPRIILGVAPECRVAPMFALRKLPWLFAFLRRATAANSSRSAAALAGLLRLSLPLHKQLIREAGREELLSERGWLKIFRTQKSFDNCRNEISLLQQANVKHDILDGGEVIKMEPALKPVFAKGIFFPNSASVTDPGEVVAAYESLFRKAGGATMQAEVCGMIAESNGWRIKLKEGDDIPAKNVVIAAGPWSAKLLATMNYRVPMAWERGYHLHFAPPEGENVTRPVLDIERGYHLAPMRRGYRITTADEFADLNAPMHLKQLRASESSAREITAMGEALEQTPWLGRRPTLPDSVPMIGAARDCKGLWFNFGHQHIGLSSSPGSALLLQSLINASPPPADPAPFSPSRF